MIKVFEFRRSHMNHGETIRFDIDLIQKILCIIDRPLSPLISIEKPTGVFSSSNDKDPVGT
jgi:hypothetical protein